MLLRSSSAPILNSWLPHHQSYASRESSSPEAETHLHKITKSVSMHSSNSMDDNSTARKLIHHAVLSELNIHNDTTEPSKHHHHNNNNIKKNALRSIMSKPTSDVEDSDAKTSTFSIERLLSNSWLGEKVEEESAEDGGDDGGGKGMGNDGIGNFNDGEGGEFSETEAYYQRMIETNPENSLFLGNYAKFLKEVKGEMKKAEEYCQRAISVNPQDGNILSLYADLIWRIHNDRLRAQCYFDRAVKSSPHDCYVQASYARFLWEAEDEEADLEEHSEKGPQEIGHFPPNIFHGSPRHSPIPAPS